MGAWAVAPDVVHVQDASNVALHVPAEVAEPHMEKVRSGSFGDMTLSAERVTWSADGEQIMLEGQVVLNMGSLVLTTASMQARWVDNHIREVEARGEVHLIRDDLDATSRTAHILADQNVVVLQDDVRVLENGRRLYAERVSLNLETGALDCEDCRVVLPLPSEPAP
jgi:lipopolysaccharide export system protein LptA